MLLIGLAIAHDIISPGLEPGPGVGGVEVTPICGGDWWHEEAGQTVRLEAYFSCLGSNKFNLNQLYVYTYSY